MSPAVLLASNPLDLFGEDSAFITVLIVICVVGAALLYLVRRAVTSQAWRDFLGISSAFLVLLFVAVVMIIVEHAGG